MTFDLSPKNKLFLEYLRELFHHAGKRAYFAIAVLIGMGLTQGIGLLMLIPLMIVQGASCEKHATLSIDSVKL